MFRKRTWVQHVGIVHLDGFRQRTTERQILLTSVQPLEAARLHLKTRKRSRSRHGNRGSQRECTVDGLFDLYAHVLSFIPGIDLDLYFQILHFPLRLHYDLKLVDGRKLANDVFDRCGINIHAANHDHIVCPPEQTSIEACKRSPACAWAQIQLHQVAGAIANHRESGASKIGDDQFPGFSRLQFPSCLRVDYFDDELALNDVDPAGLNFAFETVSSHFGSACMIKTLRVPRFFDARFRLRDVCARLSRMNQGADGYGSQIKVLFARDLGKAQRVSWGTANYRCTKVPHHMKALQGIPSAAGNHHPPELPHAFDRRPEADEWSERKR